MRKQGSNGQRLDKVEKDISELKRAVTQAQENLDKHVEGHVIEDLQEKRQYSDRYMYTYDEIANKNNISKAKVQRIAEENGLNRRNLKAVK